MEWLNSSGVTGSSLGDESSFVILSVFVSESIGADGERVKSSEPLSAKVT